MCHIIIDGCKSPFGLLQQIQMGFNLNLKKKKNFTEFYFVGYDAMDIG